MEKKTKAKENSSREDKHFSETWFRDGRNIGARTSLPYSVGKKQEDAREEVYRRYKKEKKSRMIDAILTVTLVVTGSALMLWWLGILIN